MVIVNIIDEILNSGILSSAYRADKPSSVILMILD